MRKIKWPFFYQIRERRDAGARLYVITVHGRGRHRLANFHTGQRKGRRELLEVVSNQERKQPVLELPSPSK